MHCVTMCECFGFTYIYLDIFVSDFQLVKWWPHPTGVKEVKVGSVKFCILRRTILMRCVVVSVSNVTFEKV